MLRPFLNAKRQAENVLVESGLEYTIIRPGGLSEQPGRGLVQLCPPTRQKRHYSPPGHCRRSCVVLGKKRIL